MVVVGGYIEEYGDDAEWSARNADVLSCPYDGGFRLFRGCRLLSIDTV